MKDSPLCSRILLTFFLIVIYLLLYPMTNSSHKSSKQNANDAPVFCGKCGIQVFGDNYVKSDKGQDEEHNEQ